MSETNTTPYSNKCDILADLWMNYRSDEGFLDFIEYNDLGLPIAYAISNGIVSTSPLAEEYINETFDLLLTALEIEEDTGFDSLDNLLSSNL
jgi:hypothetical protein